MKQITVLVVFAMFFSTAAHAQQNSCNLSFDAFIDTMRAGYEYDQQYRDQSHRGKSNVQQLFEGVLGVTEEEVYAENMENYREIASRCHEHAERFVKHGLYGYVDPDDKIGKRIVTGLAVYGAKKNATPEQDRAMKELQRWVDTMRY